jgi:hypothetical protein
MSIAAEVYKNYFIKRDAYDEAEQALKEAKKHLNQLYADIFIAEAEKAGIIPGIFYENQENTYYKFKDGYHWFYVSHLNEHPYNNPGPHHEFAETVGVKSLNGIFKPCVLIGDGNSSYKWLTTLVPDFVDKMPYDKKAKNKDKLYEDFDSIIKFINHVTKTVEEKIDEYC